MILLANKYKVEVQVDWENGILDFQGNIGSVKWCSLIEELEETAEKWNIKEKQMKRGYKLCPSCNSIMREDVDERLDSYWVCPNCGNKVRIFHKRIDNRFNSDCDNRGCS